MCECDKRVTYKEISSTFVDTIDVLANPKALKHNCKHSLFLF